jgi:hypothetical protein
LPAYAARRGATILIGYATRPSTATERKLAQLPFPGVFGVFYQNDRPTKNALEKKWVDSTREKLGQPSDLALLQKTFDRMKKGLRQRNVALGV